MPADFERQEGILLGANELLPFHPQALIDLIGVLIEHIPLVGVIKHEEQRRDLLTLLCDWGLPAHLMNFIFSPARGMWIRDYGPSVILRGGKPCILDAEYWYPQRYDDDQVPTELARLLGIEVRRVPLLVEGGNVLSNGRGLMLCSTELVKRNAQRYTAEQVLHLMCEYYGFRSVANLRPLAGGPTAHIDMFATFTDPTTLVMGQYREADDAQNAYQLNEMSRLLAGMETGAGPLKIVRVPMPPHKDNVWRTYTNVLYANELVVVPTYTGIDDGMEREALSTYRTLLPGRKIVTVEATSLAKMGGALRCVSMNLPYLEGRFEGGGVERETEQVA